MLAPRPNRALALVAVLAVLAVLSACNGEIDVPAGPPGAQGENNDEGSGAGGGDGGGGDGGGGDGGGGGGGTRAPGGARSPGDPGATGTDKPAGGDGQSDIAQVATGAPGSFAKALLGGGSERMVVEVLAQDGAAPRGPTLSHLTSVLRDVSGKQVSSVTRPVPGRAQTWTAAGLRGLADRHGEASQGGGQVVIRLLFLHGRFTDERALGAAVRGDLAAVFPDQVEDAASLLTGAAAIEDAVTMHEVGHLLGLVDLVLRTGRADPEHPGHSSNRSSVMYWAVESTLIADVLTGGPPRDFDDRDRADLATIRRSS